MASIPGTMDLEKQNYERYLLKNKTRLEHQKELFEKDKTLPQMTDSEKQGYLGQLERKSPQELRDLLNRQEKLLENKKFISKLADKGSKITQLAENIRMVLERKQEVPMDETTLMLEKLAIEAEHKNRTRTLLPHDEVLNEIVNKDYSDKIVQDLRDDSTVERNQKQFSNVYHSVVRNIEQKQIDNVNVSKFLPCRSIKTQDVHSLPQEELNKLKTNSLTTNGTNQDEHSKSKTVVNTSPDNKELEERLHPSQSERRNTNSRHRYGYDDSLVMDIHRTPLNHQPAKLISIDESMKVIQQQKTLHEEIMVKHAADRLAERLHIKVGAFNTEGSSVSSLLYRESNCSKNSEEEDSDDTEMDYPD